MTVKKLVYRLFDGFRPNRSLPKCHLFECLRVESLRAAILTEPTSPQNLEDPGWKLAISWCTGYRVNYNIYSTIRNISVEPRGVRLEASHQLVYRVQGQLQYRLFSSVISPKNLKNPGWKLAISWCTGYRATIQTIKLFMQFMPQTLIL